jgi:UDP-2,3-diacylglucosamine pyrophosphatase LpxH
MRMSATKRKVEYAIISDVHLGTYGCHAKELRRYLKSIKPKHLILNGDFVDIWQFSKRYWPKSHMKVIKTIMDMALSGTKIHYITGNHDEMLRKFAGTKLGNIEITNKMLINVNGEQVWIFHGDVFDVTMQHARWLTKLGATGYDILILLNRFINSILVSIGRERISLSKRIKNSVKSAVKFINQFEDLTASLAIENGYQRVICGHIHQPEIRLMKQSQGEVIYMNSGDWVENLTSIEFANGEWSLKRFDEEWNDFDLDIEEEHDLDSKRLFSELLLEFKLTTA